MLDRGINGAVPVRWRIVIAAGLVLAAACGESNPPSTSTQDPTLPVEAGRSTTSGSEPATPSTSVIPASNSFGTVPVSAGQGTAGPGADDGDPGSTSVTATPLAIDFGELRERATAMSGTNVVVEVRVFFLESCPPPGDAGGPCTLALYVAEPDRDDLLYGDRAQAAPVTLDGKRVSCAVGGEVSVACPGWTHRAIYAISAVVVPAPGKPGFELDLLSADPIGDT
jgi:hypothetical protein